MSSSSFGAGKSQFLNSYMQDMFDSSQSISAIVDKLFRSHERQTSTNRIIANYFTECSLEEPSETMRLAFTHLGAAITSVEDQRAFVLQDLESGYYRTDRYRHYQKESRKDVQRRERLLENLIDLHAKLERLRFQPAPNHKELHKTRSKLEMDHNTMVQTEEYVNRRHADFQNDFVGDMSGKLKRLVRAELFLAMRGAEHFGRVVKTIKEIDVENEYAEITDEHLSQFAVSKAKSG